MKKGFPMIFLLILHLCVTCYGENSVDTLTYAVFPYLPDIAYYQELIESRWNQMEPDVQLVRAEWDCYSDDAPEGIDVVMYDAVMRDKMIDAGWISPIDLHAVAEREDIFHFALEGLTVDDRLYGIPVFLCGNFLIYDQDCEALAMTEHITDLADLSELLVVNSESPVNRAQYRIEVMADILGVANPSADENANDPTDGAMDVIDRLAIDSHKQDDDLQVAAAYDSGIGQGYIGFSESMRLLNDRIDQTGIRSISFSDRENIPSPVRRRGGGHCRCRRAAV